MARVAPVLLVLLLTGCVGAADDRFTGTLSGCTTNSYNDTTLLLLMDMPSWPVVSGYFGYGDDTQDDTWIVSELEKGKQFGRALEFTSRFQQGGTGLSSTQEWRFKLNGTGTGGYRGDLRIDITTTLFGGSGTDTVRCDAEFKRER